MKSGKSSSTAHFVALGRSIADAGLSHVPDFHDPTARVFLNERGKRGLAKLERQKQQGKHGIGYESARVMADIMALRTMAIDKAVREAIAAGAAQLVTLGAGYDGRAWRMPELSGVKVFELDHPATQNEKRARAAELPSSIGNVTFVPIDFARLMFRLIGEPQVSYWSSDEIPADLRAAGFTVQEDSRMADWNNQFALGEARVDRARYMRIATAMKSSDQRRQ